MDLKIGTQLDLLGITSEILVKNIKILIEDKNFSENIEQISNIYRDNPVEPMESAMYWIEYVIRYLGTHQAFDLTQT